MPTIPCLDTTEALTKRVVDQLAAKGYRCLIKYCVDTETFPNKRLTHAERALLVAAGIRSGFVFERGNTAPYFSAAQGQADAETVVAYFKQLGVPAGVACFLAVDYDASAADLAGPVLAYAITFHDGLKSAGYLTGVYGSGSTCAALKKAGYAHFTWRSNASGWDGFGTAMQFDIEQQLGSFEGLASDPDDACNLNWAW